MATSLAQTLGTLITLRIPRALAAILELACSVYIAASLSFLLDSFVLVTHCRTNSVCTQPYMESCADYIGISGDSLEHSKSLLRAVNSSRPTFVTINLAVPTAHSFEI